MQLPRLLLPLLCLALGTTIASAEDLLPTLMTTRGKLLVQQDFEKPLPPFDGKSNGFASGFKAWRYNSAARGGHWDVVDGTFVGKENPAVQHPATASYGFDFKDVVIQCEVQMHDVPMDGRPKRYVLVRTTDTKDYVCSVGIDEKGFNIRKDDNDHGGPDKTVPLGQTLTPMALGKWHTVLFEILGDEMTVTVDGKTMTGQHPLITSAKCSVMFVAGVESAARNFKVWEATPNADWAKNKATILASMKASGALPVAPAAPAAKPKS
ncbi:hypothetical protein [Roseimicrobium sp. ORNL1]|uniref:hypothetical protein n=1 Tax=Roseimicrobium sp. ORNL1 TaxID=2711231 RepID=UPI0013E1699B|nr:hypothetical protein [Roseimicrobium sp. ORNL1]QIF01535.1 hypothetical protein G5S37_08365 [Roseimicrobium sp. ORNL1]